MRYEKYKQTGIPCLPEVPERWKSVPFKRVAGVKANLVSPELYPDYPQISPEQIEKGSGRLLPWKTVSEANVESDNHLFFCGQILYSKIRPLLNKVTIAPFDGLCSADMYPIETSENTRFLMYYMLSQAFSKGVANAVADRVKMPKINKVELGNISIAVPPCDIQRAIVAYLDDKCGKIDELVAAKEKEVELLKELKQTVIADAVTRGVEDGRVEGERWREKSLSTSTSLHGKNTRRLVLSGIPWLPQIPEGWDLVRNKSFLKLTDEKVGDRKDNFTLLSLTKQGVIVRDLTEGKGKFPKEFDTYLVVRPDNLVFCLFDIDETPRTVGLVRNIGMLTGAYTNFEVNKQIVLPEFAYYYYLHIDDAKKLRPFYTGLRKVVKTNTFLQIRMPVPPLDEQRAIVAYIEEKTAKIDQAVAGLAQQVAALKEYKQRLIADVVTGQMRVA